MRSLLRFIIRYHSTILFLLLEGLSIIFITQFNSFHRAKLFKVRHAILGRISGKFDNYASYLSLAEENKSLAQENARLYNLLPSSYFNPLTPYMPDTSGSIKYEFIGARVINNSTNKQYNFITLDKGREDGIEPEMGVICDQGIVGVVKESTANFSSVVSVLNREFFPGAIMKRNGFYGPVEWPGRNYRKVVLKDIPLHAEIRTKDTIVTSGYNFTFPEGIMIGVVESFRTAGGASHEIAIDLSTDFKKLSNVLVVKNLRREEQLKLETEVEND